MKIRKNDTVKVIAGKDKGKTGKVVQVFVKEQKASVEGINLMIKNIKSRQRDQKGQKVQFPAPIHVSSLMLIDPNTNTPVRVGYKIMDNKKKVRISKKTKEVIDK